MVYGYVLTHYRYRYSAPALHRPTATYRNCNPQRPLDDDVHTGQCDCVLRAPTSNVPPTTKHHHGLREPLPAAPRPARDGRLDHGNLLRSAPVQRGWRHCHMPRWVWRATSGGSCRCAHLGSQAATCHASLDSLTWRYPEGEQARHVEVGEQHARERYEPASSPSLARASTRQKCSTSRTTDALCSWTCRRHGGHSAVSRRLRGSAVRTVALLLHGPADWHRGCAAGTRRALGGHAHHRSAPGDGAAGAPEAAADVRQLLELLLPSRARRRQREPVHVGDPQHASTLHRARRLAQRRDACLARVLEHGGGRGPCQLSAPGARLRCRRGRAPGSLQRPRGGHTAATLMPCCLAACSGHGATTRPRVAVTWRSRGRGCHGAFAWEARWRRSRGRPPHLAAEPELGARVC